MTTATRGQLPRGTTPSKTASSCSGTVMTKHLTSRTLLKGQDPAAVARALLRDAEEPKSFNHSISYPKLGLA
jgi:hypothetical protein